VRWDSHVFRRSVQRHRQLAVVVKVFRVVNVIAFALDSKCAEIGSCQEIRGHGRRALTKVISVAIIPVEHLDEGLRAFTKGKLAARNIRDFPPSACRL